jgi:hypothetical protein
MPILNFSAAGATGSSTSGAAGAAGAGVQALSTITPISTRDNMVTTDFFIFSPLNSC